MSWARTSKDVKEKQLRKLWNEFQKTWSWKLSKEHGEWIKVDSYQSGWTRTYDLRDDIKNRQDASDIRQVLAMLNSVVFCRDKDFMEYHWRHSRKKPEPIKQPLKRLTTEQYNELSEKHKSYFVKSEYIETFTWPHKYKVFVTRYVFKNDFWFVFKIEPNIIEYHWHPDPEFESHRAEIEHKIERENLWPKINKMLGSSTSYPKEYRLSAWMKNKYGQIMTDEGFEDE